jgi:hypothetical protein
LIFKRNEYAWRMRHHLEANLAILSKYGEEALAKAPRLFSVDEPDPKDEIEVDGYWKTSSRNVPDAQRTLALAAHAIRYAGDREDRKQATELQLARDKFCANHIGITENLKRIVGESSLAM